MAILRAGIVSAAILVGLSAIPAHASLILNGSFESGISPGSFTTLNAGDTTSLTGWTVASGNIDYIGTYWTASNGSRSLDLNGLVPGSISQTFSGLVAGQTYVVSFDLAGNPAGGPQPKMITVTTDEDVFNASFDSSNTSLSSMGWKPKSFTFVAAGTTDTLNLRAIPSISPAMRPILRPLGLLSTTSPSRLFPNPATWAMMIMGLPALVFRPIAASAANRNCAWSEPPRTTEMGAVRNVVGIRCGAISGNMKVSFQAARSIG